MSKASYREILSVCFLSAGKWFCGVRWQGKAVLFTFTLVNKSLVFFQLFALYSFREKGFDTLYIEDYKIGLANRLHIERSWTSISQHKRNRIISRAYPCNWEPSCRIIFDRQDSSFAWLSELVCRLSVVEAAGWCRIKPACQSSPRKMSSKVARSFCRMYRQSGTWTVDSNRNTCERNRTILKDSKTRWWNWHQKVLKAFSSWQAIYRQTFSHAIKQICVIMLLAITYPGIW